MAKFDVSVKTSGYVHVFGIEADDAVEAAQRVIRGFDISCVGADEVETDDFTAKIGCVLEQKGA